VKGFGGCVGVGAGVYEAKDYAESDGKLAVYASDIYGNTSNTVILYLTDDPVVNVEPMINFSELL